MWTCPWPKERCLELAARCDPLDAALQSERDARVVVATAQRKAAQTEADAEVSAASVYAHAYQANPGLYTTLRSLEAARNAMGPNTTLILRTDSAPFKVLSDGPGGAAPR